VNLVSEVYIGLPSNYITLTNMAKLPKIVTVKLNREIVQYLMHQKLVGESYSDVIGRMIKNEAQKHRGTKAEHDIDYPLRK
jgi:isocitrate lyase